MSLIFTKSFQNNEIYIGSRVFEQVFNVIDLDDLSLNVNQQNIKIPVAHLNKMRMDYILKMITLCKFLKL